MKSFTLSIFLFLSIFLSIHSFAQNLSPVDYVNPLMGSDSNYSLSAGNTYPAIAMPWGMNFWTPQTANMGDGWVYAYDATKIQGFKQTHQPSPWINDYGQFSLFPMTGELKIDGEKRASWFSKSHPQNGLPCFGLLFLKPKNHGSSSMLSTKVRT